MRCVICGVLSLKPICKKCFSNLKITPRIRIVEGIGVYSFYTYDDVGFLLKSKYYIFGSRILKILAKKASAYFFNSHPKTKELNVYGVGIDDCVRSYYSHSAVILKEFCQFGLKPYYGKLQAKNPVQYAGKSLKYRQENPRNFFYSGEKDREIFIIDDIITTGTTIAEAIKAIEKSGSKVLFALTLCDAKD